MARPPIRRTKRSGPGRMTLANRRMLTDRRGLGPQRPARKKHLSQVRKDGDEIRTLIGRQTKQEVAWTSCLLRVYEAEPRGWREQPAPLTVTFKVSPPACRPSPATNTKPQRTPPLGLLDKRKNQREGRSGSRAHRGQDEVPAGGRRPGGPTRKVSLAQRPIGR